MRFQGFMGICSLVKQVQSSFNKSILHCCEMLVQIPRVLCLRHAVVFFCLPRTLLGPIVKCALAIWLHSLTVEISYVSCTGEVVSQILETVLRFLECIVAKSFVNVNIFDKNFKFAMLYP